MKQTIYAPNTVPTANVAVNKSRIKIYKNVGSLPTYYLQKGQEFQIELANPTKDVVLAKISLNGNLISQGGLVLNPGQRVFLDRYLDVAKKFLFDTYEVSNTNEMKKAIEDNGDLKVEFFRESKSNYYYNQPILTFGSLGTYHTGTPNDFLRNSRTATLGDTSFNVNSLNANITSTSLNVGANASYTSNVPTSDSFSNEPTLDLGMDTKSVKRKALKKSSIETGRVEQGSHSDQEFKYVNKSFDLWAFHTIEYKLLPVSQKVNTVEDLNVKVYCRNCGAKLGKTDNFCGKCGKKA